MSDDQALTVDDVRNAVAQISENSGDDEMAHIKEDNLHRAVLGAIANGAPNAADLAREALKTEEIQFSPTRCPECGCGPIVGHEAHLFGCSRADYCRCVVDFGSDHDGKCRNCERWIAPAKFRRAIQAVDRVLDTLVELERRAIPELRDEDRA